MPDNQSDLWEKEMEDAMLGAFFQESPPPDEVPEPPQEDPSCPC